MNPYDKHKRGILVNSDLHASKPQELPYKFVRSSVDKTVIFGAKKKDKKDKK